MDILYILGKNCSKCDNFELKASLRSIEKYGKNVDKIYVAGWIPDWISDNVIKIPFEQPYAIHEGATHTKACNIAATLLHVIDNSDISDEFLVSMDDHIYVREVDFDNYPMHAKVIGYGEGKDKTLLPTRKKPNIEAYRHFLVDTNNKLKELGLSTRNYTPHRNLHMSRHFLKENRVMIEEMIHNAKIAEIFCWYGNWKGGEYLPVRDIKIGAGSEWWRTNPKETEVFSTRDFNKNSGLYTLIEGLFPHKSKYEK
jgi:hypothetical protein